MRNIKLCIIGVILVAISACDNKAPNKDNFKTAINQYLSKYKECLNLGKLVWPIQLDIRVSYSSWRRDTVFNALYEHDILDREKKFVETNRVTGVKRMVPAYFYTKTPNTDEHIVRRLSRHGDLYDYLCFAQKEVSEIIRFSEIKVERGEEFVRVKFKYRIKHMQKWAQDKNVRKAIGHVDDIAKLEKTEKVSQAHLVLTDKGWVPVSIDR